MESKTDNLSKKVRETINKNKKVLKESISTMERLMEKTPRRRMYNPNIWKRNDLRPRLGEVMEIFGKPQLLNMKKIEYKMSTPRERENIIEKYRKNQIKLISSYKNDATFKKSDENRLMDRMKKNNFGDWFDRVMTEDGRSLSVVARRANSLNIPLPIPSRRPRQTVSRRTFKQKDNTYSVDKDDTGSVPESWKEDPPKWVKGFGFDDPKPGEWINAVSRKTNGKGVKKRKKKSKKRKSKKGNNRKSKKGNNRKSKKKSKRVNNRKRNTKKRRR